MNRRHLAPVLITLAATLGLAAVVGAALTPNTKAPDFTLPTLSGGTFTLSDSFKAPGKVVLLDIWATYCGPCKAEIPYLQDIHKRYKDKGLVVVGVALDSSKAKVKSYIDSVGVTYVIPLDPERDKVAQTYKVTGIPATFIIDKKGVIRHFHSGFPPRDKSAQKAAALEIEKNIKALLAE